VIKNTPKIHQAILLNSLRCNFDLSNQMDSVLCTNFLVMSNLGVGVVVMFCRGFSDSSVLCFVGLAVVQVVTTGGCFASSGTTTCPTSKLSMNSSVYSLHFLPAFWAALVTLPCPPSFLVTALMTPTATVCLMSRTAKRPRGA